jgi:hypothetical protein
MTASIADRRIAALVGVVGIAVGAASAPLQAQARGDDTILRALISGTNAFARGDTGTAARAFDVAVTGIGAIWGSSPEAQRARSVWYEESVKPFKGDPYERVMAFYYRGLGYLQTRDWGNAQAAFRNSVQQDAFAEEDQHNDDVALPLFLQGWALQAQGSTSEASEAYRALSMRRPDFVAPDVTKPQPNVLVIAETGFGPRKVPDGVGSYRLRYFRGKNFKEARSQVSIDDNAPTSLYPMEDVFWQAASRGGRQVDGIFEGKARFAQRNENIGTALTAASGEVALRQYNSDGSTSSGTAAVADGLAVVSIAALALSVRAKPAVDFRYWDNLPDAVHVQPMALAPGRHRLRFTFHTADGTAIPELERVTEIDVPTDPAPMLVWISARDRTSQYMKLAAGGRHE